LARAFLGHSFLCGPLTTYLEGGFKVLEKNQVIVCSDDIVEIWDKLLFLEYMSAMGHKAVEAVNQKWIDSVKNSVQIIDMEVKR